MRNLCEHFSQEAFMRFPFASGAKLKPKVRHPSLSTTRSDVLRTSLAALKESADGFPPLKSAVGGVVAIWDVAEGAKRSKADARDIAQRTEAILYVVADAIPDGSVIATPMLQSIERFTILLDEINGTMQQIAHAKTLSRVCHLNRNARTLADMRSRLDDAYRDFIVGHRYLLSLQAH
ncbi:hypothetical protein FB451DRAFT_283891 [Mycena latifolia]|nr:hypothetical protein FB451DRAFT_283891 [Mycena latifolia]